VRCNTPNEQALKRQLAEPGATSKGPDNAAPNEPSPRLQTAGRDQSSSITLREEADAEGGEGTSVTGRPGGVGDGTSVTGRPGGVGDGTPEVGNSTQASGGPGRVGHETPSNARPGGVGNATPVTGRSGEAGGATPTTRSFGEVGEATPATGRSGDVGKGTPVSTRSSNPEQAAVGDEVATVDGCASSTTAGSAGAHFIITALLLAESSKTDPDLAHASFGKVHD
jgi:hypothetical protein